MRWEPEFKHTQTRAPVHVLTDRARHASSTRPLNTRSTCRPTDVTPNFLVKFRHCWHLSHTRRIQVLRVALILPPFGHILNLSDRVSLFCRDYLFPQFKFLSDFWQKYDAENENSLSYFVGVKMKMNRMNRYKDLWERVFVPTIRLKYQTIRCNLNNTIKQIYKGESLNWEVICCFCF